MNNKPRMILIAGPNGSGKSTLTKHLKDKGIQFSAKVKNGNLELHEPTAPWISKFLVQKFNKK